MELASQARLLVASFLGLDSGIEEAGWNYKQTRSPHQGDLFFSRNTAAKVKKKLLEEVQYYQSLPRLINLIVDR